MSRRVAIVTRIAGRRNRREATTSPSSPRTMCGSISPAPAAEVHRLTWAWRYAMALDGTRGALLELDGAPRLECGDGPLWAVETEALSEEEATSSSAQAPSTQ